jgi:hypothetical protein
MVRGILFIFVCSFFNCVHADSESEIPDLLSDAELATLATNAVAHHQRRATLPPNIRYLEEMNGDIIELLERLDTLQFFILEPNLKPSGYLGDGVDEDESFSFEVDAMERLAENYTKWKAAAERLPKFDLKNQEVLRKVSLVLYRWKDFLVQHPQQDIQRIPEIAMTTFGIDEKMTAKDFEAKLPSPQAAAMKAPSGFLAHTLFWGFRSFLVLPRPVQKAAVWFCVSSLKLIGKIAAK